ncbi:MAG: phage regulator Rha-like protein [Desulforhopalus sp.]|jgi:phage regulator Rha-like protein
MNNNSEQRKPSCKSIWLIHVTQSEEVNHLDQQVEVYRVNERDSYVVVARVSPEAAAKLVDRWLYLEKQVAKPQFAIPQTMAEALRLAADLSEKIELDGPKVAYVNKDLDCLYDLSKSDQ